MLGILKSSQRSLRDAQSRSNTVLILSHQKHFTVLLQAILAEIAWYDRATFIVLQYYFNIANKKGLFLALID